MIIGVAPAALFAALIAPRKLQSLGATVQAWAAAVSSVRSTSNVVAKKGFRLGGFAEARCEMRFCLGKFDEETLWLNSTDIPTKATINKRDQGIVLFIAPSDPICSTGLHSVGEPSRSFLLAGRTVIHLSRVGGKQNRGPAPVADVEIPEGLALNRRLRR